jgi:butyrate kinase
MGSGITVSAHRGGRMIDQNTPDEGPFGPDRSGWLPVRPLIDLCFSGRYSRSQLDRLVFGEGGLYANLGTRDLEEVESRIASGDAQAAAVFDAMAYKIAKEIGAMAAVLEGRVDALLLTGGMAQSERLISRLRAFTGWIAPITLYPGEDELRALADGVFRVLDGEEQPKIFRSPAAPAQHREALILGLE